jgi:hypothetical protein
MSSNRLIYDTCAYNQKIKDSRNTLNYMLFKPKYENSAKCKVVSADLKQEQKAAVENELFNLDRKSTLCASKKFNSATAKKFSHKPPTLCQSIYYLTPNNLKRPTDNGLNPIKTKLDCCK